MRLVVSSLALCGVSSAYQATTARPGALANQVTMMAKSKARPRSLTQPAAAPRLPGLRPSCSHRAALVHRSRRCSMRLMGSRATLERRTASIRSACPTPSTWCASAPPAQLARDAILGVSAVHCALCRGRRDCARDARVVCSSPAVVERNRVTCRGVRAGARVGAREKRPREGLVEARLGASLRTCVRLTDS